MAKETPSMFIPNITDLVAKLERGDSEDNRLFCERLRDTTVIDRWRSELKTGEPYLFTALVFDPLSEAFYSREMQVTLGSSVFDRSGTSAWGGHEIKLDYSHPRAIEIAFNRREDWKPVNKIVPNPVIINIDEYKAWLSANKPYALKWCEEMKSGYVLGLYACCPALEILQKAGYLRLFDKIVSSSVMYNYRVVRFKTTSDIDMINRLINPNGTSPKTLFKCDKIVYTTLKESGSLERWDLYRRLVKMGKIERDELIQVDAMNLSVKEIENIRSVLGFEYNGKKVFNFTTLINYLNRIDQHEAIETYEGLLILRDYLGMCQMLGMEPKIDGDSLKREHDVAARLCRLKRNEIQAELMRNASNDNKDYNYEEDTFFIRAIEDYDDLLDEARQQHNYVASYAQRIANGSSRIYVMREKANPTKSLITVELDPTATKIRQKFLAYNAPIRNKAQSSFLDRWLDNCKQINLQNKAKREAAEHSLPEEAAALEPALPAAVIAPSEPRVQQAVEPDVNPVAAPAIRPANNAPAGNTPAVPESAPAGNATDVKKEDESQISIFDLAGDNNGFGL